MTNPPRGKPDPRKETPRLRHGDHVGSVEATRSLLARSTSLGRISGRKGKLVLRFKIKHVMYLTVWTALLLAIREPLMNSFPEFANAIVWVSGIAAGAMTAGVYGIALLMEENSQKDKIVLRILYLLCADLLLFFIFTVLNSNHQLDHLISLLRQTFHI